MTALLKNPNGKQWLETVTKNGGAEGIGRAFMYFAKNTATEFTEFRDKLKEQQGKYSALWNIVRVRTSSENASFRTVDTSKGL